MTPNDHPTDAHTDAILRDLGPDVPRPELSPADRARLLRTIAATPPAIARRAPWRTAALAATLGLALLGLGALGLRLGQTSRQLDRARWEVGETLALLTSARHAQPTLPAPDDLDDVSPLDLAVVTFDHELCPIARECTPAFRALANRHAGESARFLVLDVTGNNRDRAAAQLDDLDLRYALLTPLGGETGVVKVLDTAGRRVLCAAPGRLGIEQAEAVLARVAGRAGAP